MVYKWYRLPIGGLYATYHLLGEPEASIESTVVFPPIFQKQKEPRPGDLVGKECPCFNDTRKAWKIDVLNAKNEGLPHLFQAKPFISGHL